MAIVKRCCSWSKTSSDGERGPKSVNILLGCFFLINYNLGGSYLTYPYAFYHAGYLAAIPTLLLVTFMSTVAATWEVEVMARAQALESFVNFWKSFETGGDVENEDKKLESFAHNASTERNDYFYHHPDFKVLLTRKFEVSELCEVFFNKWAKYLYMITLTMLALMFAWSMSTVVGSALATNIPLNFGPFNQCSYNAFQNTVIPEPERCRHMYHFCLMVFALIVVPLSMMDLKGQVIFQVAFGLLRMLLIFIILIYCIVYLIHRDNDRKSSETPNTPGVANCSNNTNGSQMYDLESHDITVQFDWRGWLTVIPVMVYSYIVHHSIPALTHPIKQKKYLRWFMVCSFGLVGLCYLTLGVVMPLSFGPETQETATLSWVKLVKPNNPIYLRVISYCVIFIPPLLVFSSYPLNIHPMVNNIYTVVMGHDTSKSPRNIRYRLLLLMLRFLAATIPVLLACGVSNLVTVRRYSGPLAFAITIFFPTVLQLQSIRVCKKKFQDVHVRVHMVRNAVHDSGERSNKLQDQDEATASSTAVVLHSLQFTQAHDESSLYMTPYSSRVFSRPIAVAIIGAMGLLLFLLSITNLFINEHDCASP